MRSVKLEVLTAPSCAHCEEFLLYWKTQSATWPNVTMEELSLLTQKGQDAVLQHQIFASPGIILNNELFATGGVRKEKFIEKLKELSVE